MSKIDIKEYLGYYLGQKFRYRYVDQDPGRWMVWSELTPLRLTKLDDLSIEEIQLALRPLSSMTEGEALTVARFLEPGFQPTEKQTESVIKKIREEGADAFNFDDTPAKVVFAIVHYLISRGFDIFNLIPAGLAIDSTSNNTDNPPIKK